MANFVQSYFIAAHKAVADWADKMPDREARLDDQCGRFVPGRKPGRCERNTIRSCVKYKNMASST